MKRLPVISGVFGCLCIACVSVSGQQPKAQHEPYFIHADRLPLAAIIPAPPAAGSDTAKAELAELHRIQAKRTQKQIDAARADEAEQDIFIYSSVLGEKFNAQALPLTAAFSKHVHGEEPIVSDELKKLYARPRPYQIDAAIHPVCKVTEKHDSYPSGHSLSGYLLAFTLIEMVPEKKAEILQRADGYAHNRLVCGVHSPSDLEASRRIAYAMFGSLMQEPRFQQELAAARAETRHALGLK